MGYKDFQNLEGANGENQAHVIRFDGNTKTVDLPDASYIRDADLSREGMDLVLDGQQGQIVIDGYFAQLDAPNLVAPDGSSLSPALVQSFAKSSPLYANAGSMGDESPIGAVHEVTGSATVTHPDGSSETIHQGTAIYQGDIIETAGNGAVNIMFVDESSFAVSQDARLAIDEFVYDSSSSSENINNFSVLKGVFVYTSGMIGREDPDDVHIETPVGSIGIRGTIIAGDVNAGEITVIEGAIVLKDGFGNEMTLANQFETAKFDVSNGTINNMGQMAANDVSGKFISVSGVSGQLFSSINDAAIDAAPSGTIDANGDGQADGTIDTNEAKPPADEAAPNGEKRGDAAPVESGDVKLANAVQDGPQLQEQPAKIVMADSKLGPATLAGDSSGLQNTVTAGMREAAKMAAQKTALGGNTFGGTSLDGAKALAPDQGATTQIRPATTDQTLSSTTTTVSPTAPSFTVNVTNSAVFENVAGATVATLISDGGALGTVVLTGIYKNFFVLQRTGANSFDVRVKAGYDLDHEATPHMNLNYTATNGAGSQTVNGNINIIVQDVDDPAVHLNQVSNAMFMSGEDLIWNYNFGDDFFDQDVGDMPNIRIVLHQGGTDYFDSNISTVSGAISPLFIDSVNFNSNGNLVIDFGSGIASLSTFNIQLWADGVNYDTYTFNTYDNSLLINNGTGSVGGGFRVTDGSAINSLAITGSSARVILSSLDDNGIVVAGGNNIVNLGDGNDQVNISSGTNNIVTGGNGDDTFNVFANGSKLYGDAGNDSFFIGMDGGNLLQQIINTPAASLIHGGGEGNNKFFINFSNTAQNSTSARSFNGNGDKLIIQADGGSNGDTLNFSGVNNIKNIEILDIKNGDNNAVILNRADVMSMTGNEDTLIIRGDSNDSVNYDALGTGQYVYGGIIQDDSTTNSYHLYFDAGVTLLIDTSITNVQIDGAAAVNA